MTERRTENPFQTLERVVDEIYAKDRPTLKDGLILNSCFLALIPLVVAKWVRHPVASVLAFYYIDHSKAERYREISEDIPNPFKLFRGRERVIR